MDVFILQATICHLILAGFLFSALSLWCGRYSAVVSRPCWGRTVTVLCEALSEMHGAPDQAPCTTVTPFLSSCGNIMIEMLKSGLEIRHWWDQGDFFPFFSPLTGLHCGFVCGKPWLQTSLSQTQPYPNTRPWSKGEIGFFARSQTSTFAPLTLPSLPVELVSHAVHSSHTDASVTSKGHWKELRHHLRKH